MIEEIKESKSLMDIARAEGTIVRCGDSFWLYEIDETECDKCENYWTIKGWKNITDIMNQAKNYFTSFDKT